MKDEYWFQNMLKARLANGYNVLMLFSGRAGIGKSYAGMTLAEEMDPSFNADRVVFTAEEYLTTMNGIQKGQWIMIDEPAQSELLSKRSWWAETQRSLVDTLESNRFLGIGTILATINRGLLDSMIRDYLLHFMINMIGRGRGTVYEIQHSAFDSSEKTPRLGQLWFSRPSQSLTADYEAKRSEIMKTRYLNRADDIETGKTSRKTFKQLVDEGRERILELKDKNGRIQDARIRMVLGVGWKRAEHIRSLLASET